MPDDIERRPVLDARTLVPLGVILVTCATLISAYAWLSAQFTDIKLAIIRVENRMDQVEAKSVERSTDRYTATDHELWAAEFARLNPNLNVPKLARTGLTAIK